MDNYCVCCGAIIPDGRQVCPNCERKVENPCVNCKRVKNPRECENKNCSDWKKWFLSRWEMIHGYYEKYKGGAEDGK